MRIPHTLDPSMRTKDNRSDRKSLSDEYDTTRMNDAMRERMRKSLRRGNYTPIDDIDAYIDRFR